MVRGATIRARREELGVSLDEVSAATRIPLAHLEALEADDTAGLPAGPYAAAYRRAVCGWLGLDPHSEEAPAPATPPQGAPLWLVRLLAGGSMVALVAVLGSLGWERFESTIAAERPADQELDQHVTITATEPVALRGRVDGVAVERALGAGESVTFDGRDEVVVEVPAISRVRVSWNGAAIQPQGRQDVPRVLRFVDDGGAW